MNKLSLKLQNCYGIKKLEYIFDFEKYHNYLVYASNGMMKTSFTKTFKMLSVGKKPCDEIFQKKTICEIKVDDEDITKDNIFVVSSYEDEYISPNSAKLMVHKELRTKYDLAVTNLKNTKTSFLLAVQNILCENANSEVILADFLNCTPLEIVENIQKLVDQGFLREDKFHMDFSTIKYNDIFNMDVKKYVSDSKNLEQIKEYEARYNELIEKSPIFKRGIFSHNNAETVSENLSSNGFFSAEHKLVLHGIDKEIKSANDLAETLKAEKEKIFTDEKLKKKFDKINATLSKRTLVKLRSAIELNQDIIPLLADFESFKRKVWVDIFNQIDDELKALLEEHKKCQTAIREIKAQAKTERTQWDRVLEVFKARFTAPFNIEVPNKDDVAFADSMPEFIFKYVDTETKEDIVIQRKELEKVLSQGEKRALFLLNIINDLEALKLSTQPHLIIIDDIAESFDYKNKYAIIEYLQEMMQDDHLHFIVLTHNFDFYRTVANRLRGNIHPQMVQRVQNGIEITNPKYVFKNPFETMKKGMIKNNDKDIITSIPFVRNLIEYTSGVENKNYAILTALLHIKANTKTISLGELQTIFNTELKLDDPLDFAVGREDTTVFSLIDKLANEISLDDRDAIDLSGKIIISMAIRLIAEEYMIAAITDSGKDSLPSIDSNQTGILVKLYKDKFPDRIQPILTLNKMLLMSSENIHINSFMFEPLIDISISSLIRLYGEILILSHKAN